MSFCVNRKYSKVITWSPLEEFYDPSRKNIILLDDNILASPDCNNVLDNIIETGRRFKFKQGLDLRLITDVIADKLISSKYLGEFTFAFDDWAQRREIEKKVKVVDII